MNRISVVCLISTVLFAITAIAEQKGGGMPTENKTSANTQGYTKPTDDVLRQKLTSLQYAVTQEKGTEAPFKNEFWNEHRAGIYVDVVSGEPLFSSLDKFESGSGWPSFSKPLVAENITRKKDFLLIVPRTEVRSRLGDSHLGHVFDDGPQPAGLRYCINSAALRFIPAEDLEKEGYSQFVPLFKQNDEVK